MRPDQAIQMLITGGVLLVYSIIPLILFVFTLAVFVTAL